MKFLGPLQMRVMRQMWFDSTLKNQVAQKWVTIKFIQQRLNWSSHHPELAYTTIATVVNNLVRAKFMERRKVKGTQVLEFQYLASAELYEQEMFRYITEHLHGGDENSFFSSVYFFSHKGQE